MFLAFCHALDADEEFDGMLGEFAFGVCVELSDEARTQLTEGFESSLPASSIVERHEFKAVGPRE